MLCLKKKKTRFANKVSESHMKYVLISLLFLVIWREDEEKQSIYFSWLRKVNTSNGVVAVALSVCITSKYPGNWEVN